MPSEKVDFKINWSGITHQNVDCLKLLVNKTFPLTYDEGLYDKIVYEYHDNTFFGKLKIESSLILTNIISPCK